MNTQQTLHSRIAPTPSGFLHLGNVFNFVLTYLCVRKHKGTLQLRIDDIDATRRRKEYVDDVFYVLDWLGLNYDSGPSGVGDFYQNYSQQNRLEVYRKKIEELWEKGVLFACSCSRSQIKRSFLDGQYPGTCRSLNIDPQTSQTSWRIQTPQNINISWEDSLMGKQDFVLYDKMRDFVLKRKDDLPAYQLVSVIEDIENNINFIVRGEDLISSTAAQLFISQYFPNSSFGQTQFLHHPLLTDQNQQKLSKSAGAMAMRQWMEKWKKPVECYRWIGETLGMDKQKIHGLNDLQLLFDPQKLKIRPFLPL